MEREQRAFFARNGFIQQRQLVSATACEQMVRWTEDRFPAGWRADRPKTWVGSVQDACHSNTLLARRGRVQYATGKLADHPILVSSYGPASSLAGIARSLIGSDLAPELLRGLYPIFPIDPQSGFDPFKKGHNEAHPSQLITITYLRDVELGGGGPLVWPGSHRAIYPAMGSKLEFAATAEYQRIYEEWTSKEPLELCGQRGDVTILHHRLLHAASVNLSDRIRFAFLCDYWGSNYTTLCQQPPTENLWEDWPAMKALTPEELAAAPDFPLLAQAHARPFVDARRKLKKRSLESNATSKRKGDASILERSRTAGDRWLVLSDAEPSKNDWKLYPRGSDLASQGTKVRINGRLTQSVCQYDYIVELDPNEKLKEIRIEALKSRAWVRVIRSRLPFAESEIELRVELVPGTSALTFQPFPNHLRVKHKADGWLNRGWLRRGIAALRSAGAPDWARVCERVQSFGAARQRRI